MHPRLVLLLPLAALLACPKAPPTVPQPPRTSVRIPAGCEARQDGEWVHERDTSFRYTAVDDGRTLVLTAFRQGSGGTASQPEDAAVPEDGTQAEVGEGVEGTSQPTITLRRTAGGFLGETTAEQFLQGGVRCKVPYPTEVIACTQEGLSLSTAAFVAVDAQCHPAPTADDAPREIHRLVRPSAITSRTAAGDLELPGGDAAPDATRQTATTPP